MTPVAQYQTVEVGAIVRFEAPGSRNTDGQPRIIPAVVLGQWPDGSLQLYGLHFEGPFLVNSIPLDRVEMLLGRTELDRIEEMRRREMTDLENRVAAMAEDLEKLKIFEYAHSGKVQTTP